MRLILASVACASLLGTLTAAPSSENGSPFGITYAAAAQPNALTDSYVAKAMSDARELGATAMRWDIPWQGVETSEGRFDWRVLDRIVQAAVAANIELILGVGGYSPGTCCAAWPRLYAAGGARKLQAYESFLHQMVSRYRGRIHYWQIENEVALPTFWGGTPEEYLSVLKTAYGVVKSEDPEAKVLLAGIAGNGEAAKTDYLLERGRDYFDIVDAHLYMPVDQSAGRLNALRASLSALKYSRPIWVTETGGPHPCMIQSPAEPSPEVQSAEVVKRYARLLAAGAERVFWFGLQKDTVPDWKCGDGGAFNFMMLVRGQERRPAFATYQFMVRKLAGLVMTEGVNVGQGVSAIRFSGRAGSAPAVPSVPSVLVVWADRNRTVNLTRAGTVIGVSDLGGVARKFDPRSVAVSPSPLFVDLTRR